MSNFFVEPVHVSSVVLPSVVVFFIDVPSSRLKSTTVVAGHFALQGVVVVLQNTVAEALLIPMNAMVTAVAMAAKLRNLMYRMVPPCSFSSAL